MESNLLEIHHALGGDCGLNHCRKEFPPDFEVEEQTLCVACFNS